MSASHGSSGQSHSRKHHSKMPKIHWCSYKGDVEGVRACLKNGDDVCEIIVLANNNGQNVLGVTPLYLAAQEGHQEICKLLLDFGANLNQKCCIPSTGEVFGPDDIALVRLHLKTYWFLAGQKVNAHPRPSRQGSGSWGLSNLLQGFTSKPESYTEPLLAQSTV